VQNYSPTTQEGQMNMLSFLANIFMYNFEEKLKNILDSRCQGTFIDSTTEKSGILISFIEISFHTLSYYPHLRTPDDLKVIETPWSA